MSLYTKYRSQKFKDLIAQDHISEVLKAQIIMQKVSHAYIFTGPRGCGKTSAARIFAKAINCLDIKDGESCDNCINCLSIMHDRTGDFIEMDAASNRSIDDIREFKEKLNFPPTLLKRKIIIIDEVHMLTKEAFNALLKTLEEPPNYVVFILATTDIHKVPATILSRTQRFDFKLASDIELSKKLKYICTSEGVDIDDATLELVSKLGAGSFRDSESILDKLVGSLDICKSNKLNYVDALSILGLSNIENIDVIINYLLLFDFEQVKLKFENIQKEGMNLEQFFTQLIDRIKDKLSTADIVDMSRLMYILRKLIETHSSLKYQKYQDALIMTTFFELCDRSDTTQKTSSIQKSNFVTTNDDNIVAINEKIQNMQILIDKLSSTSQEKNNNQSTVKIQNESEVEISSHIEVRHIETQNPNTVNASDVNLDTIKRGWVKMIQKLSEIQSNTISGVIAHSTPISIMSGMLIVKVKYKIHKSLIEKKQNESILDTVTREIYGQIIKMSPIYGNDMSQVEKRNDSSELKSSHIDVFSDMVE